MITASKTALLESLKLVGQIVERRNTVPILGNALFFKDKGGLAVRVTDLDIEAIIPVKGEALPAFHGITLPAHLLSDIVRKLPEGADIRIEPDTAMQTASIKSGRSRFSLQMLPPGDFPTMDAGTLPYHFSVSASALASAIAGAAFAISTEETRYYLNGIFCVGTAEGIRLVATDGHRLAKRFIPMETPPAADMPGVIIPRKTVDILGKHLPKDGDVKISLSDSRIRFEIGGTVIMSKLIDGTFPDYMRVIPPRNSYITVESKVFAAAIDRVSTLASESRAAAMTLADGVISLVVSNPDNGRAEDEIAYAGEAPAITIGFKPKYIADVLAHLPDGDVRIGLDDPGSPAVFRGEGEDEENLIVLMPMRV